jgi:hypothetical protein
MKRKENTNFLYPNPEQSIQQQQQQQQTSPPFWPMEEKKKKQASKPEKKVYLTYNGTFFRQPTVPPLNTFPECMHDSKQNQDKTKKPYTPKSSNNE